MSPQNPKNRELFNLKYENHILVLGRLSQLRVALRRILALVSLLILKRTDKELDDIKRIINENLD